ncbi:MAG: hypothetical protein MJ202_11580 [Lentisphaeria bacterium]|nr:hypothetical protein [Lentisphaeria bacterium]
MDFAFANSFVEELAFGEDGIVLATDWWKLILIAFSALLFLFLLVRLALYIMRIVGVILCVAAGVAGGWLSKLLFAESLARRMPENGAPYASFLACVVGFLVCFAVAGGVMTMIRKPAQPLPKEKK